ncbi:threonine/serine dehydratase [Melioribacteraceae bacterium 4301-Me]|uniref:threonine ammonia-lyase n=1 Tax=Pyranulibacter aquaticus TaxID=3163344 RepID=UPI003598FEE3
MQNIPSKQEIERAHERIKKFIHRTPVFTSSSFNEIFGGYLFFKCENLQRVGAFKMRGASNVILSLSENELLKGVATHSSGNHAAAVSLAAKLRNTKAYIVMPHTAPQIKQNAVRGYGAEVILCEPTLQSREETLKKVVEQTGAYFIHPYNDARIVAGQASAAKEVFEEINDLDFIIAPVGGGGLLSGTALSTYFFSPSTKVIGAEPKGADDAFRSIRDNKIYPSINPKTIADGLLTQLGELTFSIIKKYVSEIITVEEDSIVKSMRMIWERMKIIVEPSAAVTLAVLLENKEKFENKKIGLILSGGNVDLDKLPWC